MKIGILTFHYAYNFGAVWQCYALQQTLLRLGYEEVEVINVIPSKWHWFLLGIPHRISIETLKKAYLKMRYGRNCRHSFDDFREKHLRCSEFIPMNELNVHTNRYNAIIVGSDQVWAPSQRKDILYFLNWEPQYQGRKIAYAPCCTVNVVIEEQKEILRKALNNFDRISARNIETQRFISDLTGINAPLVPDPTLLIDFVEFIKPKEKNTTPYILSFVLGEDIDGSNAEAIRLIRLKHTGCKVIAIVVPQTTPVFAPWADEIRYDVTPIEWLNLIANACIVYTDSFHCTIFSIKFQIPFIAYYCSLLKKSRFEDLKQRFGISEHIVTSLAEVSVAATKPVPNCDKLLAKQREIGIAYLLNSLNSDI